MVSIAKPSFQREIQILQTLSICQEEAARDGTQVYQIANTGLEAVSIYMNLPCHIDEETPLSTPA